MRALLSTLALGVWVLSAAGCDVYDRPRRPLPEDFRVVTLEGETLTRADLKGRPWVINIWVPG